MTDPRTPSSSPNLPPQRNLVRTIIPEPQNQQEQEQEREQGEQEPSQPSPSSPSNDLFFAGIVIVNIVHLSRYSGSISEEEFLRLVREPLNAHDANAIKVLNSRTQEVGYVELSAAAALSPLIDSGLISVEGILAEPSKIPTPCSLLCFVILFAPLDSMETVKSLIWESDLQLIFASDDLLEEAFDVKGENPRKEICNYNQIFETVGASENIGKSRKIVEPPKEIISSELFLHQKEGLAWLIERENSCELPPFWEVGNDGSYVNVLTNFRTKERPEPLQGGIFADDMGLGKTLTLLSLIAANRPGCVVPPFIEIGDDGVAKLQNDEEKVTDSKKSLVEIATQEKHNTELTDDTNDDTVEDSIEKLQNDEGQEKTTVSVSKKSQVRKSGRIVADSVEKHKIDAESEDVGPKATLIVCTSAVLSTWSEQLDEHTQSRLLKVYWYHGECITDVEELQRSDIVLTTYGTLSAEKHNINSPVWDIEWWRIILDEAHIIKNVNAPQSQAVINLKSKRRWAVTGTPILNGSFGLFSLMAFLKFQPFSIKSYWQSLVQRPLSEGSANGFSRLQALMRTISLRRTKESLIGNKSMVELPPKTVETCFVEFSAEEREQYDRFELEAKRVVNELICADRIMRNYSTVLHMILRLRQMCNCLDLCPSDISSLFPSCALEDVSNNPELLTKMVSILQEADDFDCPVCLSPPSETIITCCGHIFCRYCILKTLQYLNPCCPICRKPLSNSDIFSAPPQPSDDNNSTSSAAAVSSKVSMLLKLLLTSREESPSTKSVVFSQFRKMLILLEQPLKEAGFSILRLDGSMTAREKSNVIKEFRDCSLGSPTVLLASRMVAGAGINLTAASRAYLLEPWWNSRVEEQAMNRVHRIGQKEEVKVVRLIVRNSIEERVLELHKRKKDLVRGAFGKSGEVLKQMRVENLRTIMQL